MFQTAPVTERCEPVAVGLRSPIPGGRDDATSPPATDSPMSRWVVPSGKAGLTWIHAGWVSLSAGR
jgi:hypothetical protein